MGYHPHGVYAKSLFANIIFNRHWFELFPGIQTIISTLPVNFSFPATREFLLCLGFGSCESAAVKHRLTEGESGTAMIIVIGGAEEFKHMDYGTLDLIIKKRKGFVKLALATGASLVPILAFGENEVYSKVDSPVLRPLHDVFHFFLKSAAPLFVGRYGTLLPKRHPLITVVGRPIYIDEAVASPSHEQIDQLHDEYLQGLQTIYDEFKDTFHTFRKQDMRFIK
ncbi:Diacylglycerol O-acyltransferase 2 [Kappamyces sp. JEL0829]|nr:Diacylglycerol O-acyltransferase 2 [Kappamyces sp. JEL0829]